MEWGAFQLQLDFDNLLGVVPRCARVGHENGLIEPENSYRHQVADEKERVDESEGQSAEEDCDEDVQHASLGILRADGNHLLAVGDRRLFCALQLDMRFDELHCSVRAGS